MGSGGEGALTTGNFLLEAAAAAGWYGLLNRTFGSQIRGGEAAALIRLAAHPIGCLFDQFDLLIAVDWLNADRFDAEIPLGPRSLMIGGPRGGDVPANITVSGARLMEIPLKDLAKAIPEGRANMIARGVAAKLLGLGEEAPSALIEKRLKEKGASAIAASRAAIKARISVAADIDLGMRLGTPKADTRRDGSYPATRRPASARYAAVCASPPPTRSRPPPKFSNGWRPIWPSWVACSSRPRTNSRRST